MGGQLNPKIFTSRKIFDIPLGDEAVLLSKLKQFRSDIQVLDFQVLV